MKLLTIIVSRDLDHEVSDIIAEMEVDCYVKLAEAYGISHACKGTIGENMPWEATLMLVSGEAEKLEELAGKIKARIDSKPYKPCLRMMLSAADRVWA